MKLIVRWVMTSLALFIAAWLVPGISVDSTGWLVYAIMAVVLGLVNATVRPILKFLTCPFILLTLGLGILVINALTLWLSSQIAVKWLHVGFYVNGFWPAFLGGLIVSAVSLITTMLLREDDRDRERD